MTSANETSLPLRAEQPPMVRGAAMLLYGAALLFFCKLGIFAAAPTFIDPLYTAAALATLIAALLLIFEPGSAAVRLAAARVGLPAALGAAFMVALALGALLWPFNLDDKWAYYRTSINIFKDGVPNYNAGEWFNINTSFLYPYLVLPGHFFGDFREWEVWTKLLGFAFHLGTAVLVLLVLGTSAVGILTTVAVLLYVPNLLWSLGGLETPMAVFAAAGLILFYLTRNPANLWFWFLSGAMVWLRPDAILIAIGIFVAQYWMIPRPLAENLVRGIVFSIPILLFLAVNHFFFGLLLPSSFYVKGWNKAFSGFYPWYFDFGVGSLHLLSGLLVSFLVTAIVLAGLWRLGRSIRFAASFRSPVLTEFPRHVCVLVGLLLFLGYHVQGGYQHMNFTFRYFIPGIIGLVVMCGHLLVKAAPMHGGWLPAGLAAPPAAVLAILLQMSQSSLVAYHAKWTELALTVSELRDKFSVMAYADWMETWIDAGAYLRQITKPTDRIYIGQGMATGGLTNAYLRDQFYAPPLWSKYEDLRKCAEPSACAVLFDYYLAFPGADKMPPGFELMKEFAVRIGKDEIIPTLAILRRKPEAGGAEVK